MAIKKKPTPKPAQKRAQKPAKKLAKKPAQKLAQKRAKKPATKPAKAVATAKRPAKASPANAAPAKAPETKAVTAKRAKTRFAVGTLMKLAEYARAGDAHSILAIPANLPIREALSEPLEWNKKSYDRLLALYLGNDTFGHADWSGYIYDFAEHTFFHHDDEGYLLAQLNSDLGAIHASRDFGVLDEKRAIEYFRAALAGPRPEDVVRELENVIAASPLALPLLAELAQNPQPED